jgi:hypothetical protein
VVAERTLTPGQRHQVVTFAEHHGPTQAAQRFRLPVGTVKAWQARARALERRREARAAADRELPDARRLASDPDPDPDESTILRRMVTGQCLRCGGSGRVRVPAVTRGSLTIRPSRVIACPDCGGPVRHLEVVEHPRADWTEGQRVAGDLGAGWSPALWARIRAGEVDPDGYRITGRSDA